MSRFTHNLEDEHTEEDEGMPDISLQPPTPFEGGASLESQQQGTPPPASHTLSAYHQSTSPHSLHSDHTFAWQDSPSQTSSGRSRPSSTSGWSVSGNSDDSLFAASATDSSIANSPLQGGKSKSHARKKAPGHVSRPRNAFILFRSHAITNKIIPPSLGVKDNRVVSCIVATLWKSLPEEERKQWKSEADKEKELHRKQYPDYQFKPGTSGTKGKMRTHAKTEETVKEQCELIADQILRAHGRSPTREEGQARKKKDAKKAANASRSRDGLPRARKSHAITENRDKRESMDIKQETDDEAEYIAPVILTGPRRRSSSVPMHGLERGFNDNFKSHEPSVDMFASWQERIEEHQQSPRPFHPFDPEIAAAPPATVTPAFTQIQLPSFAGRRAVNPAALRFTVPSSFGDAAFASPRTIAGVSAPSPRYTLFNLPDRPTSASPISARRPDDAAISNIDAMLLSPFKSSFYDSRTASHVGWQSWSRYSYADIALPILNPRLSVDGQSSRRSSLMHRPSQSQDLGGGFPPATPDSAHLSLHHSFFSPTTHSFHQRDTDYESHEEDDAIPFADGQQVAAEVILPFDDISNDAVESIKPDQDEEEATRHFRPTSSLADADTTPSLGRLALSE